MAKRKLSRKTLERANNKLIKHYVESIKSLELQLARYKQDMKKWTGVSYEEITKGEVQEE